MSDFWLVHFILNAFSCLLRRYSLLIYSLFLKNTLLCPLTVIAVHECCNQFRYCWRSAGPGEGRCLWGRTLLWLLLLAHRSRVCNLLCVSTGPHGWRFSSKSLRAQVKIILVLPGQASAGCAVTCYHLEAGPKAQPNQELSEL